MSDEYEMLEKYLKLIVQSRSNKNHQSLLINSERSNGTIQKKVNLQIQSAVYVYSIISL